MLCTFWCITWRVLLSHLTELSCQCTFALSISTPITSINSSDKFINPNSYELQLNWGSALKNLGKFDESLAHLDLAENINPMDSCVWLNKGVTLEAMDRQQEALECYDKAIDLNPNFLEAHCNKANSLMVIGQYSDAMEEFKSALAINPNDYDTLYNLSLLQLAMGDFVSGWKNYENRWLRENTPQKMVALIRVPICNKKSLFHAHLV